jgi:endonuclease/exonuclease/phosphatase family metal-dependent hydrolase
MFSIFSLNCEGNKHLDQRIIPWLVKHQPDVVCFQEFPEARTQHIAQLLGAQPHFAPTLRVDNTASYFGNPTGVYGVAMFAHHPVHFGQAYYDQKLQEAHERSSMELPIKTIPNSGWRALIWGDVTTVHGRLRVGMTHFTWAAEGGTNPQQMTDLKALLQLTGQTKPEILCGDFNAPRGGALFATLAQHFTDNIPPEVTTTISLH